jgi:thioredoxin reductase
MPVKVPEYLVIGAGPAGLQMAYFLAKAGRTYLVREAGPTPGAFFRSFPRHRRMISNNKKHTGWQDPKLNLRMEWNPLLCDDPNLRFTSYTIFPPANDFVRYLGDFAAASAMRIQCGTEVVRVARNGCFHVTDAESRIYAAEWLIVAPRVSKPYIPPIPGVESAELYTAVSVDPRDFVDQRVLIIGKGNSAFESADNLIETAALIHVAGPSSINFAWRSHYVGHLRAVNNNLLDTYLLKSQNGLLDGNIERIERQEGRYLVTVSFGRSDEIKRQLPYDRVIVCTGFRFDSSIFYAECRPELVYKDRFPAQPSERESSNVRDLYFAGTLMQARDLKKSTGGFVHGFRYGVRALHRMLERKYHGKVWPHASLAAEPQTLMDAVIARVNRTSALWHLFGFLCDLIVAPADDPAWHYEEVPVDYVHESDLGEAGAYFVVTLEYGPGHDQIDPFDISVGRISQSEVERSHEGRFLHPVVRHYSCRKLISEHHITENLENEWTAETTHSLPLQAFIAAELTGGEIAAPAAI